jgi:phosphatidate cytidylyltransferase
MPSARRSAADRQSQRRREEAPATRTRPRDGGADGRRRPPREPRKRRSSDLLARILVAVPAAILAIVFVDLGGTAWAVLMAAAACACLYELYALIGRWKPASLVGFASALALVGAARFGTQSDVLEISLATLPVAFLAIASRGPGGGLGTVSVAGTMLGVVWIGLAFAHATLLRQEPHGAGILIDIMVGTFLGDTAAYLGGRLFGRRALAPSISPHKTFEGLVCGMLIAILAVFIAGLNQPWLTQGDALLLGVTVAVLGPIGDLFESMVKRDAGAKDAGGLFGAHGGALDRLDAVIFTVVAGYYVWVALLH